MERSVLAVTLHFLPCLVILLGLKHQGELVCQLALRRLATARKYKEQCFQRVCSGPLKRNVIIQVVDGEQESGDLEDGGLQLALKREVSSIHTQ